MFIFSIHFVEFNIYILNWSILKWLGNQIQWNWNGLHCLGILISSTQNLFNYVFTAISRYWRSFYCLCIIFKNKKGRKEVSPNLTCFLLFTIEDEWYKIGQKNYTPIQYRIVINFKKFALCFIILQFDDKKINNWKIDTV